MAQVSVQHGYDFESSVECFSKWNYTQQLAAFQNKREGVWSDVRLAHPDRT